MKMRTKLLMSCSAALALSACGGNGIPTTQLYTDDVGTAAEALEAGESLVAQEGSTSAVTLNYSTGDTNLAGATFQVSKNEGGELTMVLNGVEQVFTTDDRKIEIGGEVYGYQFFEAVEGGGDIYVSLFNWIGELDDAIDETNPRNLQVWGYQSNLDAAGGAMAEQPDLKGFAVVGTGTDPSVLGALPTASYSGWANMQVFPATGFVNNETSQGRLRSDLDMTADFGAATISGELSDIEFRDPGSDVFVGVAGTVSMDESDIVGNGFAGSLTGDGAFNADSGIIEATGTYSGNFYGSEAEEVGGAMTLTGTDGDGDFNGVGFFVGDKID